MLKTEAIFPTGIDVKQINPFLHPRAAFESTSVHTPQSLKYISSMKCFYALLSWNKQRILVAIVIQLRGKQKHLMQDMCCKDQGVFAKLLPQMQPGLHRLMYFLQTVCQMSHGTIIEVDFVLHSICLIGETFANWGSTM